MSFTDIILDFISVVFLAPILIPCYIIVGVFGGVIKYFNDMSMWLREGK